MSRMSKEEFFAFLKEHEQENEFLEYYLFLQQCLKDALKEGDTELFNIVQQEIDNRFGEDTWVDFN